MSMNEKPIENVHCFHIILFFQVNCVTELKKKEEKRNGRFVCIKIAFDFCGKINKL